MFRTGLVIEEAYPVFNALRVDIRYPGFITPFISILMKEIRREAGVYVGTAGDLISSPVSAGAQYPYRQIEAVSLCDYGRILVDGLVSPVHVAMQAAGTGSGASVPQVPVDTHGRPRIDILFR